MQNMDQEKDLGAKETFGNTSSPTFIISLCFGIAGFLCIVYGIYLLIISNQLSKQVFQLICVGILLVAGGGTVAGVVGNSG